jgi:AcrR family transcriptional regulator
MTPYRYFADKAELLFGLWWCSLEEAFGAMKAAVAQQPDADARARLRASIGAYLHYWETHPDHFRLVYMTEQTTHRDSRALLTSVPIYADIMADSHQASCDLAAQIGVAPTHAKLASDLRLMMGIGFLYSMLVNQRYPWSDRAALRSAMIDNTVAAMERCLTHGASAPPGAPL